MPKQVRYIYEFGPFRLDPAERLLMRGDQALSLTPKALDTLIALVERSRHIVTKDELMSRVWPDIYVEETNLAQHISMLRKIMVEREDGGQYIENHSQTRLSLRPAGQKDQATAHGSQHGRVPQFRQKREKRRVESCRCH